MSPRRVVQFLVALLCAASCCGDLGKEFDTEEREADLYLFTRPVNPGLPDEVIYHHWALVFHFEGDDIRTIEGFEDEAQMLYPAYTKVRPREKGNYYMLGKVLSSPSQVLELARANRHNNQSYSATWHNCQAWVKEVAVMLGEEITRKINNFKTLKEAYPAFAFAGKTASSFSRVSQSVTQSVASKSASCSAASLALYKGRALSNGKLINKSVTKSTGQVITDLLAKYLLPFSPLQI